MHKVVMVYGYKTDWDLQWALNQVTGEIRQSGLSRLKELRNIPSTYGTWNVLFEEITRLIFADEPNLAFIPEEEVADNYLEFAGFDAVIGYHRDPETGCALQSLHIPVYEKGYAGDWWVVGGRWRGSLPALKAGTESAFKQKLDYPGTFKSLEVEKGESTLERLGIDTGYNCLPKGSVDWEKWKEGCKFRPELIDEVAQKTGRKSMESIFMDMFGEEYATVPEEERTAFREVRSNVVWSEWFKHRARLSPDSESGAELAAQYQRLNWNEMDFLGYDLELLKRYAEVYHFVVGGVFIDGVYINGDCGLYSTDSTIEQLIQIGEKIRDLPSDTVVTVVDMHY